ncbi:hypothetical protein AWB80_08500 [Caballeronia pedi]|uniref:Uncharacterized protein n=1 Tax=Caballeronia pedi TaxID=1777141 RepID=A0A158E969_9BURK|nr:hypothetical protein AWB80_08500 [Caballeronia pedi]
MRVARADSHMYDTENAADQCLVKLYESPAFTTGANELPICTLAGPVNAVPVCGE